MQERKRHDRTHQAPPVHTHEAPPIRSTSGEQLPVRPQVAPVPQTSPVIRCPYCRSDRVRHNGTANGYKYYRCLRCCDMENGEATTFKVAVVDPLRK